MDRKKHLIVIRAGSLNRDAGADTAVAATGHLHWFQENIDLFLESPMESLENYRTR